MKIGRNAPCPCGCGQKFKHCQAQKREAAEESARQARIKHAKAIANRTGGTVADAHSLLVAASMLAAIPHARTERNR